MKNFKFSRKWIFIIISVFSLVLHSCKDKNKECIKCYMEEEGYSYDDAVDACNDAEIDSQVR